MTGDAINPDHYKSHPSGVECITITEHMGFNLGNAVKYIWRADEKGNALEDLRKAAWYVEREIARRIKANDPAGHEMPDPRCQGVLGSDGDRLAVRCQLPPHPDTRAHRARIGGTELVWDGLGLVHT